MDFIDKTIILRSLAETLIPRLEKATRQSNTPLKVNFRCHICGDSQKNKNKKRGYLIEKGDSIIYYCHNCGYSKFFPTYLKEHHPDLYQDYVFQTLKARGNEPRKKKVLPVAPKQKVVQKDYLKGLTDVMDLPKKHPAIEYLLSRKVPLSRGLLYYTDNFAKYVNSHIPGKFKEGAAEDARVVIAVRDSNGKVIGAVGRAIDKEAKKRYFTIIYEDNGDHFYGLERLDKSKHAFVVEGPIDSLFLPNAIALMGSVRSGLENIFPDKQSYTIVLDNQPRNPEIVHKYETHINNGENIVIWPDGMDCGKDINDMVLSGMSTKDVVRLLENHTFNGLKATIEFKRWKKI